MEEKYKKLFEVGVEGKSIVLVENQHKHSIPPYIVLDAIGHVFITTTSRHKIGIDWCKTAVNCANRKDGKIDDKYFMELLCRLDYDFGIGKHVKDML